MWFEWLIDQSPQGQVDSLALGPESVSAHHLSYQAGIEIHVRAHCYTSVHHMVRIIRVGPDEVVLRLLKRATAAVPIQARLTRQKGEFPVQLPPTESGS